MALDPMSKLIFDVAQQKREAARSDRMGTVHEVDGDKIRVNMGLASDGSPLLSPWLHTTDHRGGTTERDVYRKGQNVRLAATGADMRQATVSAYAPNQANPPPGHADSAGTNAKTLQAGPVRTTVDGDGSHNVWIDDGSGGAGKPKMIYRASSDGFLTGRVGDGDKSFRFAATDKGVHISHGKGDKSIWVTDKGCFCTEPLKIDKNPLKFDDDHK
jgi:hypothetical protein